MADAPTIPDEAETRAFTRHAELVSASTASALEKRGGGGKAGPWTLKQRPAGSRGDENGECDR